MNRFDEWWECIERILIATGRDDPYALAILKSIASRAWEAAQPQWQPIETAPENTLIIVRNWDGHIWEVTLEAHCEEEKNWYLHDETLLDVDPTHWMPLPEVPQGYKNEYK